MNVRELIQRLEKFDPDLPVCTTDWVDYYFSPLEIKEVYISKQGYSEGLRLPAKNLPSVCLE